MSFENGNENSNGTNFGEEVTFGRHYPPSQDEYEDPMVPYLKFMMKLIVPIILIVAVAGHFIQQWWQPTW